MGTFEAELVSESLLEIIPFFGQILAGIGRHCCKNVWKIVAGTQTVLLAASMGPISSMAQERTWFFQLLIPVENEGKGEGGGEVGVGTGKGTGKSMKTTL